MKILIVLVLSLTMFGCNETYVKQPFVVVKVEQSAEDPKKCYINFSDADGSFYRGRTYSVKYCEYKVGDVVFAME